MQNRIEITIETILTFKPHTFFNQTFGSVKYVLEHKSFKQF